MIQNTVFTQRKQSVLSKLDKSIKQSIDKHLRGICDLINANRNYFTTSCCSGRAVLMTKGDTIENKKLAGQWLLVSHDPFEFDEYLNHTIEFESNEAYVHPEKIVLKYEPIVMHIACLSMDDAVALHNTVFNIGFRNSGISSDLSQTKFIVAVRCTIAFEVEIGSYAMDAVHLAISRTQMEYFHSQLLMKFELNFKLIHKLEKCLKDFFK